MNCHWCPAASLRSWMTSNCARHQPAPAVVGMGGHQLGLTDRHAHAVVGPRLGDQTDRRDDASGRGVLDHRDVVLGPERRRGHLVQLERPFVDELAGQVLVGLDLGAELGQLQRVLPAGHPQDEPVAQATG